MALSTSVLSNLLYSKLITAFPIDPDRGINPADLRSFTNAVASAVVEHLEADAEIVGSVNLPVSQPLLNGVIT